MNFFKQTIAAAATATGLCVPAFADTTLNVHYPMVGFFKDVMDVNSKKFIEENPDIRINFVNPSAAYKEESQTILRRAGTSELPGITFIGLNRLRLIAERGVNVDMKPHIAKEKDVGRMVKEGGMPVLTKQAIEHAFVGDKVGISLRRDDC
jgi:multiple sugar transport system substrate-binding protein